MTLKRQPRPKPPSITGLDADRARHARAGLITFSLRGANPARLWTVEIVPNHGARETCTATRVDDWREILDAQIVAGEILSHLADAGCLAHVRACKTSLLFALEVVRELPPGWRLDGRQVLEYCERLISGHDLVRAVATAINGEE